MKILVTAGSTQVNIDQVRVISNIFRGRTGTSMAKHLNGRHEVTLITSNPEMTGAQVECAFGHNLRVLTFKTFDELAYLMEQEIRTGNYDVVIHSAAVSDYRVSGVFSLVANEMVPVDASRKISSNAERLFLELSPTYKIVDKIRSEWGFTGVLVKFKLQVGMSEKELIEIASRSRATSDADFIVANCLEWSKEYALIIDRDDIVERVSRSNLPNALERRLRI